MQVLKRLCSTGGRCATGRTVIAVVHQPASEVFFLFDALLLLASGRTVYLGPADQAEGFFDSVGIHTPHGRSVSDHLLHQVNADFGDAAEIRKRVDMLCDTYLSSPQRAAVERAIQAVCTSPGPQFAASNPPPHVLRQTAVLTQRSLTNNLRDVGVFWARLVMYLCLCGVCAFVYFRMGHTWQDVYSRAAILFFTAAFLVFMSISGAPAFVETMKVFTRERLNGYYPVGAFATADMLAGAPFIALIALLSACVLYFITNLNYHGFGRFVYFTLNLYAALLTAEAFIMCLAPLVTHFLVLIAIAAGAFGVMMTVSGFFQPRGQLPRPLLFYPMHFLSFETYLFYGFLHTEFDGTHGWGCPCSAQPGGCSLRLGGTQCTLTGTDVLRYWQVPLSWNKWVLFVVQLAWAACFRLLFYGSCKLKEWRSR